MPDVLEQTTPPVLVPPPRSGRDWRRPAPRHAVRRRSLRRTIRRTLRRVIRLLFATALVATTFVVLGLGVSVVGAVRTPGNEGFKAKWADWLRDHHGESLVAQLENWYFQYLQTAPGGQPDGLNPIPAARMAPTTSMLPAPSIPPPTTAPPHLPAPYDVPLIVQPGLPDEGIWQPTGVRVQGLPAMYMAQFRADDIYTGQITTAVWCDPTVLRLRLVPGATEPGGSWSVPAAVEGDALRTIVAAFNGGFRFEDARGGFYLQGTEAVPLREGAASVVVDHDGRVQIGEWGRDVAMTPDVEAVLQNLSLIVDNGELAPNISRNDTSAWGATLDGQIAVARSGIGITGDGALVYVAGPSLTARSLADSLRRAGAVRALTLDINPTWVTFNLFEHPDPADATVVTGHKLYPEMERPAERYLTTESRDFFTISLE